jgi:hypothetical protein
MWNSTVARFARYTSVAASSHTTYRTVPSERRCATSTVSIHDGK